MSRTRPSCVFMLGVALAVVSLPPPVAQAEEDALEESSYEIRAGFEVQTDELGEGAPSMAEMIGLLEDRVLRERGVGPAAEDTGTKIIVVIRPLPEANGVLDNRVDISLELDGTTITDPQWSFDCPQCTDGYLLNKVAVTLHSVVTRLESEVETVSLPPGLAEEDHTEHNQEEAPASPPRPGPMVWAGTGVGIGGLVVVGVGLGLALRADRIDGWQVSQRVERVETRTPGWAMVGCGTAALVAGGALLAVGLVRHRRAKAKYRENDVTAMATPWASPAGVGLGLVGRF